MDETPSSAGSLLPPATTRWQPMRPAASSREPRIAPPFVVRTANEAAVERPREAAHAPVTSAIPEPAAALEVTETNEDMAGGETIATNEVTTASVAPETTEADPLDESPEAGVVRPAFEVDTDAALEAFSLYAADLSRKDDFPLEAFIVPEQAQRVPSGMEGKPIPAPPEVTPLTSLADRLEKLSHRLRIEETESIIRRLASGDRLDTMLAGLLAGYLAGTSEQS